MTTTYDGVDKLVADYLAEMAERLQTEDRLWVLLFPDWSAEARDGIAAVFRNAQRRPTIRLAYPRSKDPWPVWAVFLQAETPQSEYLGLAEGALLQAALVEGDDPADYEQYGMGTAQTIQIMVVAADSPDVCRWHSLVAKRLMMAGARYFHQYVSGMSYLGSQDLAPDPRYLPENLFVREQRWQFQAEEVAIEALEDGEILRGPALVALEGVPVDEDDHTGGVAVYQDEQPDTEPEDLP